MPIPEEERHELMHVDEELWRYISFAHLVNLIRTRKLLFRRVSCFPDPFEGSVPKALFEMREEIYEKNEGYPNNLPEILSAINKRVRDSVYANCWHRNDRESEAMWEHYGNTGVAIVTDVDSIFESLKRDDRTILVKDVSYLNFYDSYDKLSSEEKDDLNQILELAGTNLLAPTIMKRKSFQHENEIRLLLPGVDLLSEREYEEISANIKVDDREWKVPIFAHLNGENGALDLRDTPDMDKKNICVDLDILIKEIRIAPGMKNWFRATVEEVVDNIGPDSITSERVRPSDTDLNEQRF